MNSEREFDLFQPYPEPAAPRAVSMHARTIENRIIASYRGKDFYDGDRVNGYGGMIDDGRWKAIASTIVQIYNLVPGMRVLQLNAHKGFLLRELVKLGMRAYGVETSDYAIQYAAHGLVRAPFNELPYQDKRFDLVIAASAVYSFNLSDAITCLREIQRVSTGKSWITLAAMEDENDIEGLLMLRQWFLTGNLILTKSDWLKVMEHAGYTGDYRFDTARSLKLERAP